MEASADSRPSISGVASRWTEYGDQLPLHLYAIKKRRVRIGPLNSLADSRLRRPRSRPVCGLSASAHGGARNAMTRCPGGTRCSLRGIRKSPRAERVALPRAACGRGCGRPWHTVRAAAGRRGRRHPCRRSCPGRISRPPTTLPPGSAWPGSEPFTATTVVPDKVPLAPRPTQRKFCTGQTEAPRPGYDTRAKACSGFLTTANAPPASLGRETDLRCAAGQPLRAVSGSISMTSFPWAPRPLSRP